MSSPSVTPGPSCTGPDSSWIASMRRDAANVSIICFMVRANSVTGLNDARASTLTSGSWSRAICPSRTSQTPIAKTASPPSTGSI